MQHAHGIREQRSPSMESNQRHGSREQSGGKENARAATYLDSEAGDGGGEIYRWRARFYNRDARNPDDKLDSATGEAGYGYPNPTANSLVSETTFLMYPTSTSPYAASPSAAQAALDRLASIRKPTCLAHRLR